MAAKGLRSSEAVLVHQSLEAPLAEACLLRPKDAAKSTVGENGLRVLDSRDSRGAPEFLLEDNAVFGPSSDFPAVSHQQPENLLSCDSGGFLHLDSSELAFWYPDSETPRLQEGAGCRCRAFEHPVPVLFWTPDGDFVGSGPCGMELDVPLLKEPLALACFLQRVQMLRHKIPEFLFASLERPVERAGTKLQTSAYPLVSLTLETEGQDDIAHCLGPHGTLLTALYTCGESKPRQLPILEQRGKFYLSTKNIGGVTLYCDYRS